MDLFEQNKKITPYQDIDDVLCFLAAGIQKTFGADLFGAYLTGSLSYGDFDEGRSDIDLAVILKKAATPKQIDSVEQLHFDAEQKYEKWSKRIECSYIPQEMLPNVLVPETPRPYVGGGKFYPAERYGNEWLINKFFLRKYGIAITGPKPTALIEPVDIVDLQKACVKDFYKEWEPKMTDDVFLDDSHQQSYVVLNLCRIIYTVACGDAVSKKAAAAWAKKEYPQWENLIETADSWHYGIKMERKKETIGFIKHIAAVLEKNRF